MAKQTTLPVKTEPPASPIAFARHETFHPRFGWLKKGYDRAAANAHIFLDEDAPVQLGVGKNMVRSIRYWCQAFKLLANDQPTDFGERLLGDRGWDPYLEDPASLWLLHWQLLQPPCYATAWDLVFNQLQRVEFTADDLFYELGDHRDRLPSSRIADSSIKKDVSCLLRMYAGQTTKGKASWSEDALDCPFTELRLIQTVGDARHYGFRIGPKPNLPAEIITYAVLQFAAAQTTTARTITLAQLTYDGGSPGRVFKLTEAAVWDAIAAVSHTWSELVLEEGAGKLQLSFKTDDPRDLAQEILADYYDAQRGQSR